MNEKINVDIGVEAIPHANNNKKHATTQEKKRIKKIYRKIIITVSFTTTALRQTPVC